MSSPTLQEAVVGSNSGPMPRPLCQTSRCINGLRRWPSQAGVSAADLGGDLRPGLGQHHLEEPSRPRNG